MLLLGPLYHLTARADRLRALAEARRVLRPGGFLFAAAISRFASLVDNITEPVEPPGQLPPAFADPAVLRMVRQDLAGGPHENTSGDARYFTTAYFHHPDELADEVRAAGLALVELLPARERRRLHRLLPVGVGRSRTARDAARARAAGRARAVAPRDQPPPPRRRAAGLTERAS